MFVINLKFCYFAVMWHVRAEQAEACAAIELSRLDGVCAGVGTEMLALLKRNCAVCMKF